MRERSFESRHLLHALLIMFLVLAGLALSLGLAKPAFADSNFYITDYDIEMEVNEDDTYKITETIDVHFTAPSHGIYRTIPYRTYLNRDGQSTAFYGKVRDFKMLSGQKVEKEKGDQDYFFRIGDENKYADTDTTYKMSYVFDMRGDHLKGADEVFYNMVGTSWEAQGIEHVSFRVTFPKEIDMNKVGIKTGQQVDVPFESKGSTVVYGETDEDVLGGLTIRAVLPEGYFTRQASSSNFLMYVLMIIIAAATGWGFLLWRKYGRDPDIIETEEFYPPEGISAAEIGYLDSGEAKGEHVTSLLLTLADKGYLRITETQVPYGLKKKKTKTSYEITQLKEYDGSSEDELLFMEGLFKDGRTSVEMSDLKDKFYKTVNAINKGIVSRFSDRLWDQKAKRYSWILRGIGLAAMIALFVVSKILNGSPFIVGNGDFLVYCLINFCEIVLPLAGFYGIARWVNSPKKKFFKILLGFMGCLLLILLGFGLAVLFDTCMQGQRLAYVIGLALIFCLFFMAALCEKRTDEYTELLGKIRGYKRFLKVAEKDQMEMLAEQDPDYFYRNLAYAFALGVTAVYAERFAVLAKEPPTWYVAPYYGTGMVFDATSMTSSMNSMMSSVTTSMVTSPSGGGGGGSFGGGGGAGGGGGGSW